MFLAIALVGLSLMVLAFVLQIDSAFLSPVMLVGGFLLILFAAILIFRFYSRCPYCGKKYLIRLVSLNKSRVVHCSNCGNEIDRK